MILELTERESQVLAILLRKIKIEYEKSWEEKIADYFKLDFEELIKKLEPQGKPTKRRG